MKLFNNSIHYKHSLVKPLRFYLGIIVMSLGLLTIGFFPSKSRPVIGNSIQTQNSPAQLRPSHTKYLGKYRFYPNEPVSITNINIKGNPVNINSHVSASHDWLKNLSFDIQNISNKPIIYISLQVLFPQTKTNGPILAYPMHLGERPRSPDQFPRQALLMPNETVKMSINDDAYTKLKNFVETRTPIENISDVQIDVDFVAFDDDTAWATGAFMHRKPGDMTKWVDDN
jgi:hypothetical protein